MSVQQKCTDCQEVIVPIPHHPQGMSTWTLNHNFQGLCRFCKSRTPCSVCNKTIREIRKEAEDSSQSSSDSEEEPDSESDDQEITMEVSDFDKNPICSLCKKEQCYKCGSEYAEHTTWHGKSICEDCGLDWCNKCGDYEGGCDERCPSCDAPCDAECGCEIECEICGDEFTYEPFVPWQRKMDGLKPKKPLETFEDYKCVCTDCWGDEENTSIE